MGTGAGGKSEIDRDGVRKILKILEDDLDKFSSLAGGPKDIEAKGKVGNAELGGAQGFQTGTQLAMNTERAYDVISSQYVEFIKGYRKLLKTLNKAVGDHEKNQDNTVDNINRVQPSNITRPTTNNTKPW